MPEFKITIGHNEFVKSDGYMDIFNCPIAIKLKSLFPHKDICVGGTSVCIGKHDDIAFCTFNWRVDVVENLIRQAHEGRHVSETFEIVFPNFPQELLNLLNPKEVSL